MADLKEYAPFFNEWPLTQAYRSRFTQQIEEAPLDRITSEEQQENDARINNFTPAEQKKIIRRIDRRLVLTLGCMYCVSLMDRTNLPIAVVVRSSHHDCRDDR